MRGGARGRRAVCVWGTYLRAAANVYMLLAYQHAAACAALWYAWLRRFESYRAACNGLQMIARVRDGPTRAQVSGLHARRTAASTTAE